MSKYPSEYEIDLALRDGGVVGFRPIKPDDAEKLYEHFHRLGPESRYFRFFRVKKDLSPKELEYFTNVDYKDRMAFRRRAARIRSSPLADTIGWRTTRSTPRSPSWSKTSTRIGASAASCCN